MFIKAVLREQKLPFEVRSNSFDNQIYQSLKEAEHELEQNSQRYTIDEVAQSMNDIIG